jgi:hypothetical protein
LIRQEKAQDFVRLAPDEQFALLDIYQQNEEVLLTMSFDDPNPIW